MSCERRAFLHLNLLPSYHPIPRLVGRSTTLVPQPRKPFQLLQFEHNSSEVESRVFARCGTRPLRDILTFQVGSLCASVQEALDRSAVSRLHLSLTGRCSWPTRFYSPSSVLADHEVRRHMGCETLNSNLAERIGSITLRRHEIVELVADFSKMEASHCREIKSIKV